MSQLTPTYFSGHFASYLIRLVANRIYSSQVTRTIDLELGNITEPYRYEELANGSVPATGVTTMVDFSYFNK